MTRQLVTRLAAVFVAAAIPNILVGQLIDVAVWQSATLAGAMSLLSSVQQLAVAYRDKGKLDQDDIDHAIEAGS